MIDLIQAVLQAAKMEVERDMGRALHLKLNPFARHSDDGLEILTPAALVGDPNARRVIDRGGVNVVARGYTLAPSKAAGLNELRQMIEAPSTTMEDLHRITAVCTPNLVVVANAQALLGRQGKPRNDASG